MGVDVVLDAVDPPCEALGVCSGSFVTGSSESLVSCCVSCGTSFSIAESSLLTDSKLDSFEGSVPGSGRCTTSGVTGSGSTALPCLSKTACLAGVEDEKAARRGL